MEKSTESDNNLADNQIRLTEASGYQEQIDQGEKDRILGAKILSQANFEARHRPIVESSFSKVRQKGEKLFGKNNERRNYSYLNRIESLIDKYGNRLEKRLWNRSVDRLVISPEDITDDYWRTQEQILRDNGQGRTLGSYEKRVLTENIQKVQRESLQFWADYFSSEGCPFPIWFKIYAWDGVSKMGVFDKERRQFIKRDKHTTAPYPKLNPAVLAKVYGAISKFYDQSDKDRRVENLEHDIELETLVESGNFNKLYSKILLNEKIIHKTPERTEDIHGEWIEYLPGDEKKLAVAAEGTPWCVVDPGIGKNYLEHGDYSGRGEDKYNKAKFILFHLRDLETSILSDSACASIRLDSSGKVAEISGLNKDQTLEDSLVPIVEEKVCSLPGGQKFLKAFADKKRLIVLDGKMKNDEDLTKEELEFLYEIHRPIEALSNTCIYDPRINELKQAYNFRYAIKSGIEANRLVPHLESRVIVDNLSAFIDEYHVDVDSLVSCMASFDIVENLSTLIDERHADVDNLVSCMEPSDVADNLNVLIDKYHADIDVDKLVSDLSPYDIIKNLTPLIRYGAEINVDELVSDMSAYGLDTFFNYDASSDFAHTVSSLVHYGVNIDNLVSKMSPYDIARNLDTLAKYRAKIDIDKLVSDLSPYGVAKNLDILIRHHASIDIDRLVSELGSSTGIFSLSALDADDINALRRHGANI